MIFSFSSQQGSTSKGMSDTISKVGLDLIQKVGNFELTAKEETEVFNYFVVLVRKVAHMTEYFILGIILFFLGKEYKLTIYSIFLICLFFALTDEIHQLFIIGRVGSIVDVGIDMIGAIVSILFLHLLSKRVPV